jgi:hypothetical protein
VAKKTIEQPLEDFLDGIKDVELDGIDVRVVEIHPEEAELLLQRNTHNRPLRSMQVEEFVDAMKAGLFRFNGDAIRINADGTLDDGQHRLTACVMSGVPLVTTLVTGLGTEIHSTLDKGLKRDLATDLLWEQEDRPGVLSQAVRLGASLRSSNPASRTATRKYVTDSACLEWFRENRGLTSHIAKGSAASYRVKGRPEIWAVLSYVTSQANAEMSEQFMDKLTTGIGLESEKDPIWVLRNWVYNTYEKARSQRSYVRRHVLLGTAIKAWNAYVEGREITTGRMVYKVEKSETWPIVHG